MKGNRIAILVATSAFLLLSFGGALPAAGQDSSAVAKVSGGGTAFFVDPRFEGGRTQFAVGATVFADGTGVGVFECVIKGVLSWHITVTGGSLNSDGSVTVTGPSIAHFAGGGFVEFDAFIIFYAGGPGEGMFCAGPPTFADTLCDVETVVSGQIRIR